MQVCTVYFKNGSVFVVSQSQIEDDGAYISVGPMSEHKTEDPREVGGAIVDALRAWRDDIRDPSPSEFKLIQEKLLQFLGVRRWGEVARSFTSVGVEGDGTNVTLMPQRVGQAASLVPGGSPICLPQNDLEGIGRAAFVELNIKDAERR